MGTKQFGGVFKKIGGYCHHHGVNHLQFKKDQAGAGQNGCSRQFKKLFRLDMAKTRAGASGRNNNPC